MQRAESNSSSDYVGYSPPKIERKKERKKESKNGTLRNWLGPQQPLGQVIKLGIRCQRKKESNPVFPASLGYPPTVVNENSTLKESNKR